MKEQTNSNKISWFNDWRIVLVGCLTLGLAPYLPEPHLIGKIRWVWGGAGGMKMLDWMDLLFHGIPWILLARIAFQRQKTKANG